MMMELDDKIWSKNFDELTSEEKQYYTELFENEAAFEQIKLTMKQINVMDKSDILNPEPEMKEELMASFQAKWREKPLPWYKKIWIFLLNPGKPIFYKPAFQIGLSIAMVVLLLQIVPTQPEQKLVAQNNFSKNAETFDESIKQLETSPPHSVLNENAIVRTKKSAKKEKTELTEESVVLEDTELQETKVDYSPPVAAVTQGANISLDEIKTNTISDDEIFSSKVSTVASAYSRTNGISAKKMEKRNTKNIAFSDDEHILLNLLETAY